MMKRSQWLILFLLLTTLRASAQDQTAVVAAPSIKLVSITLLVRDYDKATKWYSENLGFQVRDNKDLRPGKRWVTMFSKDDPKFQIFLLKPGDGYMAVSKTLSPNRIGKETYWILRTPDFDGVVKHLKENGVRFRSTTYETGGGEKKSCLKTFTVTCWCCNKSGPTFIYQRRNHQISLNAEVAMT